MNPVSPPFPHAPLCCQVREQLLVDLDSSRARVKRDVIRRQLWKHLSTRKTITPAFGEAVLFEHEVYNPQPTEIVLHATVSHPEELVVVRDVQEWKASLLTSSPHLPSSDRKSVV